MSKQRLGQEEWEILRYVAEHAPTTVREVAEQFAETKGHARTTVLTVMERLRKKRFLVRRKCDGLFHYSPRVPLAELVHGMVDHFVQNTLQGVVSPFFAYLSESANVSDEELDELKRLVKDLEQQRREASS
ncbi:MAG: BlaI/MecI/CopY family transcriptional regulator [Pirellulales bacterium]|nr:BlaI/MecI/CopY family transcriptional regulator [Pirellulales bacterium]